MTVATDAAPAQKTSSNILVVEDIDPALNEPPARYIANFGMRLKVLKERSTAPIIFKYLRG